VNVLGVVTARGGSKGLPRKNVRMLAGKPMLAWTAEAARGSRLQRVVCSSEDAEILEVARQWGLDVPFVRPDELAADTTPTVDVVLHLLSWLDEREGYRPDAVMLLQPTSPLRRAQDIDAALDLFEQGGTEYLVSVCRVPHSYSPSSALRMDADGYVHAPEPIDERTQRRQLKPTYYARNGAIYLVARSALQRDRSFHGARTRAYEMPWADSVDVDEAFDLEMCEWLLGRRAGTGPS
jgi:CMP-N,N'-diacetyllegionaminic acid synthase